MVLGNSRIFGYDKDGGRLVVNEEQAQMVRELFQLYATGDYSMKQIENIFWDKGYRNLNGNKIAHSTMSNMIANPKYKGWYVGNKVKVVDMFTKKQKFLPPEEWVMVKDETGQIVPAIVSEELWDKANVILKNRSEDVKSRQGICNHPNLFTGKLYCTCCGQPYYRRESKDQSGQGNSRWVCSGKIKNGSASCPSFTLYESELVPIIFQVFRDTKANTDALIEEYTRMYRELTSGGRLQAKIKAQEKIIDKAKLKKAKLLELAAQGNITGADFKEMSNACNTEIDNAEQEIRELEQSLTSAEEFKHNIDHIRTVLAAAQKDVTKGTVSKEFISTYIDRIFVTPVDENTARLDIRIFTGRDTQRYLQKLKSRLGQMPDDVSADEKTLETQGSAGGDASMGVMFKKMIEAYENGLK